MPHTILRFTTMNKTYFLPQKTSKASQCPIPSGTETLIQGQEWRPGNLHFHNHLRWFWGRWYIAHTLRNADLKHKLHTAGPSMKDLPWSDPQPALWLIFHYLLPSQAPCSTQTGLLSESALLTTFSTWKCPSPQAFLIQNLFRLQMPTHSPTLALPTQLQIKLNADSIISILLMKHVLSHLY